MTGLVGNFIQRQPALKYVLLANTYNLKSTQAHQKYLSFNLSGAYRNIATHIFEVFSRVSSIFYFLF